MTVFIRNQFLIVLSLFFISALCQAEDCRSAFSKKEVKKPLTMKQKVGETLKNKKAFIRDYQGQAGYLNFTEGLTKNMDYVFELVSQVYSKKERKALGWQKFQGTVEEFKETLKRILNNEGKVRPKYKGMEGYLLYADTFYKGDMQKAYKNVSAVLGTMQALDWQSFRGTSHELRKMQILDDEGKVRPKYKGMEGYLLYADTFYEGDMQKTYMNVSAVLEKNQMQILSWQKFQGKAQDYRKDEAQILDDKDNLKYKGMEGYALYADSFYEGDMQKAYKNVSAVLSKNQMQILQWQLFAGTLEEFRGMRSKILTVNGNVRSKYKNIEGYVLYADSFYEGDMKKAYKNVSAVLDKKEMQVLQWQSFQGTSHELRKMHILDDKDNLKYKGMEGHALYADSFYEGDMKKTYVNVSAVLSKEEMRVLGWKLFEGSAQEYRKTEAQILTAKGNLRSKYKGMEGYALYADRFYEGDMKKTYVNVSTVLAKEGMRLLGWKLFQGKAQEYRKTEARILDEEGKPRAEYKGMEGYVLYADTFSEGNMKKAYRQVSAVLGGFQNIKKLDLGWKLFHGFTIQYHALKDLFYESEELKGLESQERVAREIFKGDMKKTYYNVSILKEELLGGHKAFTGLEWTNR